MEVAIPHTSSGARKWMVVAEKNADMNSLGWNKLLVVAVEAVASRSREEVVEDRW